MAAFWRSVCPDALTVTDVPGDHFGCMRPPHVADVAAKLPGLGGTGGTTEDGGTTADGDAGGIA